MNKKIAFILQVHQNPIQLNKFIKQLTQSDLVDVYIHIDKKSYDSVSESINRNENVYILNDSIDVSWGDISQVDATLLLLKAVLSSGINYDYICFRSGQDLLVKDGFIEYLYNNNNNKILMTARKVELNEVSTAHQRIKWFSVMRKRYSPKHPFRILRRIFFILYGMGINLRPNRYKLPEGYSLYKGDQWFTLTQDSAKFILNFLEENEWYYKAFKYSLVPDERFFQTLLMNSKYKDNILGCNSIFLKWGRTLKERNSPVILEMKDIQAIDESGHFFARKFDEKVDFEIVDHYVNSIKL